MKRRIISCGLILVVLLTLLSTFTGCDSADKIPIPKVEKNVFLYDEDNIIDDVVEKDLNKMLVELEEKSGAEFAVISIQSLKNRSIENYANNLFNTLGIGKKGKDNGVLLLISRSDNRVRLEIGRGLEGCLNDSKCGRILDKFFVPYREEDKYTEATEYTVKAVLKVLCEEYNISISGVDESDVQIDNNEDKDNQNLFTFAIIVLIIIIIAVVIIVIVIDDNSSGGHSSGGFYSGGDGFSGGGFSGGGFGGGFSGGGGASR